MTRWVPLGLPGVDPPVAPPPPPLLPPPVPEGVHELVAFDTAGNASRRVVERFAGGGTRTTYLPATEDDRAWNLLSEMCEMAAVIDSCHPADADPFPMSIVPGA